MRCTPFALVAVAAGCGAGGDGDSPCSEEQLQCVPGEELTFEVTPFDLAAGQERSMCLYFDWPEDAYVQEIKNAASDTLHHLELVQLKDEAAMPSGTEVECPGTISFHPATVDAVIYGTSGERDSVAFPSDEYGVFVGKGRPMLAHFHFINHGDTVTAVSVPIQIKYTTDEPTKLVSMMILDQFQMSIPRNTVPTCPDDPTTCHYEVDVTPQFPVGGELFWSALHFNTHGVLGEASILRIDGDTKTFIVETSSGAPSWFVYDPPVRIHPGDRIRWSCFYNNFGETPLGYSSWDSSQEMCRLGLYVSF